MAERYFVELLASRRNGTLYSRRGAEHKSGLVQWFTRKYGVKQLVHLEAYSSILEARAREYSLKRWRRAWKLELIEKDNPAWRDLAEKPTF